ncbi:MAG: hypothetical protein QM802_09650 [Agriterribacter sp.]
MAKRIAAYTLIILGILTFLYFRNYSGELIPYPSLFWSLGIAILAGGVLLLRLTPSPAASKTQKQLASIIADLKNNGEKISVDLTQCELKEQNYVKEKEKKTSGYDTLLMFDDEWHTGDFSALLPTNNVEQVQVVETVIIFSTMNNRTGETERFVSRTIPKDKITVAFYLEQQRQTTLYVDKTNRERYYFDLDFLNS